MMLAMQLERSRTALRQATQAVEELRGAKDRPELFRDRFPLAMGAVQRVGSVIDAETEGHRTPEFGMWWKETQSNPLFIFLRDVRNAEFKRGESRQKAHHQVTLGGVVEVESALSFKVIRDGKVVQEGRSQPREKPAVREKSSTPSNSYSADWYFSGGGLHDGQEILSVVDRYLAWLREDILPTAERLTTSAD
jgi:hypothetical protein